MSDKRGPGREHERFQTQQEYTKPIERNLDQERVDLFKSIKPSEQMPENTQEKINTMLSECKEGKCKSQKELEANGYKAFNAGKFADPSDVHPGHIGYLFANNVLTEGRPLDVGEYKIGKDENGDGYAFYHKA